MGQERNGFDYTTVTGGMDVASNDTLEFAVGDTKFTVTTATAATGTLAPMLSTWLSPPAPPHRRRV